MRTRTGWAAGPGWAVPCYALTPIVLLVDALTDRAFVAGVLYLPLVLLASLTDRRRTVVGVATVGVVFIVLGAVVSPSGASESVSAVVADRVVSLLALAACGWLAAWIQALRVSAEETVTALRRTESEVRQQHELMRIAGQVGHFGGWTLDVATEVQRFSREASEILDLPDEDPSSLEDRIARYAPDQQPRLRQALSRCMTDAIPVDEELCLTRDDGRTTWIHLVGRGERDAAGAVVRVNGSVHDISSRKVAELEAERGRQRVRILADAMPVLVWTTSHKGGIDYVSRGLTEYAGVDAAQILGDAWLELLHPDDRALAWESWTDTVRTGAPYSTEFRIRRHDGAYRWHLTRATPELDEQGVAVTWWGSWVDIHDRRLLETRSRELTARLTWTLESINDAVVGLDTDWRITVMNENAARLLRRTRESLMGRVVWDEFPEAVGTVFDTESARAVRTSEAVRFQAAYAPIDRYLEVTASPHAQGLTIFFRDLTESRQLTERLGHVQRLESLGQLTGGVAHDFNNLLTVVLGSSELLARQLEPDSPLRSLTDRISSAATRGADLTHSLLAFARRQPLHPSVVDIDELVLDTERLLGRTLGSEITVTTTLSGSGSHCLVDRVQLGSALLNLCVNARDAMSAGGTLLLETSEVVLDESYAHADEGVEPGHYVTVAVSDNGAGIVKEDLDHVFEPFFTTKPDNRGSGLGLAMVYGFAKQSRGHVTIESEPGSGTTVRLYLPMAAAPAAVQVEEVR